MEATQILDCGHEPSAHLPITTGYGTDASGRTSCYACCADMDRAQMIRDGRTTLYLRKSERSGEVTNWPGSLRFRTGPVVKGRHNLAGTRYDTWFTGPDGREWHAVQYGENTEIAHCKRIGIRHA